MAGPWLRPVTSFLSHLESGQSQRTSAQLTTFCIDFSDRVFQVTGIRPMIYINGNYASYVQPSIVSAFPNLWTARWPNQSNPGAIDVQNGQPKDSYTPIYGPWDDLRSPLIPGKSGSMPAPPTLMPLAEARVVAMSTSPRKVFSF